MGNSAEDDECTNIFSRLSLDDDTEIKSGFLDRLAELLCYKKDTALISSTALIYSDEEATIVAARNSSSGVDSWSHRDCRMLEDLSEILERISCDGLYLSGNLPYRSTELMLGADTFESHPLPRLQRTLVEYYCERIRHHAQIVMSIENGVEQCKPKAEYWRVARPTLPVRNIGQFPARADESHYCY